MDLQREVTRSIFFETGAEIAASAPGEADGPGVYLVTPGTRKWAVKLSRFSRDGAPRIGPDRASASGGNGEFALEPITIEIHDPRLKGPLLRRLARAYREQGWQFKVVGPPGSPAA